MPEGTHEINKSFKKVRKKLKDVIIRGRICYRVPDTETKEQPGNVFGFDLETYDKGTWGQPYACGLYDVNRLEDIWNRYLTERELERE